MSLRGLVVAIQFMTRIPVPALSGDGARDLRGAAMWLPLTGALVGGLVALAMAATHFLGPSVAALVGAVVWVLATGGLHVDGLGDVADAMGARHRNRERFLEVARDPRIGGFGAIAIVLLLLWKVVLLAEVSIDGRFVALPIIAAWARWVALVVAYAVPPMTKGLGSELAEGVGPVAIVANGVLLAALSFYFAPALAGAVLIAMAAVAYWVRTLGAVTGDCHGATIEITEALLLLALLAVRL